MKFRLEIEMDNAGFEPNWENETGDILKSFANRLQRNASDTVGRLNNFQDIKILDINGNAVGKVWLDE